MNSPSMAGVPLLIRVLLLSWAASLAATVPTWRWNRSSTSVDDYFLYDEEQGAGPSSTAGRVPFAARDVWLERLRDKTVVWAGDSVSRYQYLKCVRMGERVAAAAGHFRVAPYFFSLPLPPAYNDGHQERRWRPRMRRLTERLSAKCLPRRSLAFYLQSAHWISTPPFIEHEAEWVADNIVAGGVPPERKWVRALSSVFTAPRPIGRRRVYRGGGRFT